MKLQDLMTVVVNDSSELIQNTVELNDLYLELPHLVELEHEAISSRDFQKIDRIGKSKTEISTKIEAKFYRHQEILNQICEHHSVILEEKWQKATGVFSSVDILKAIVNRTKHQELAVQVLENNIEKLAVSLKKFRASFEKIQPELEKNRVVIQKMIESQQESYRFWTEVAKEESSSYDAAGNRNTGSKSQNSLLNVRA